ncbi:hypothetical protein EYF80_031393 [Liparis tanakae]|uniref:Uncharacterized protein n=1 Tax=Liparis tanakae TaxID=230148 RepID=A0A4Z2H0G5_9TELE|nr:hypothetical protein EYF80_031393 [Liparis tanakae]
MRGERDAEDQEPDAQRPRGVQPESRRPGALWESVSPARCAALTGVSSSGVEMGELSLFSLMPLPRSKSQIFTGEI